MLITMTHLLTFTIGLLLGIGLLSAWIWYHFGDVPIMTVPDEGVALEEMRVRNPIDGQLDYISHVEDGRIIITEAP